MSSIFTNLFCENFSSQKIENYYGFENGINGEELYKTGIEQSRNLGAEILEEDYSNFDTNSEDDKAIMDIFNSIPD